MDKKRVGLVAGVLSVAGLAAFSQADVLNPTTEAMNAVASLMENKAEKIEYVEMKAFEPSVVQSLAPAKKISYTLQAKADETPEEPQEVAAEEPEEEEVATEDVETAEEEAPAEAEEEPAEEATEAVEEKAEEEAPVAVATINAEEEAQLPEEAMTETANDQDVKQVASYKTSAVYYKQESEKFLTYGTEVSGEVTARVNLRDQANEDSFILEVLPEGTELKGVQLGDWVRITRGDRAGYFSAAYFSGSVDQKQTGELPADAWAGEDTHGYVQANLNVRKGPGTDYDVITVLPVNYEIKGTSGNGWIQFEYDGQTAYVASQYVKAEKVQIEVEKPAEGATQSDNDTINQIVAAAEGFVGMPYIYGASDPSYGFDCSGLTSYLYKHYAGVSLNRRARDQAYNGYAVSKSDLKPGDILLFYNNYTSTIGHVGIYIGNDTFVHASTPSTGVIYSNLSSNYYTRNFAGARRILN